MINSKIIGTLSSVREMVEIDGEKFFNTFISIDNVVVPARVPEYLENVEGKCEITCYIASESKGKLFTYIEVLSAKPVPNNTKDVNFFKLSGKVLKNKGIIPIHSKGTVSLALIITYTSGVQKLHFNNVHLTATDKIARQLATAEQKTSIKVNGTLQSIGGCLSVQITEIVDRSK